jgi:hypothetical protein
VFYYSFESEMVSEWRAMGISRLQLHNRNERAMFFAKGPDLRHRAVTVHSAELFHDNVAPNMSVR